jgi:hypothetical protein
MKPLRFGHITLQKRKYILIQSCHVKAQKFIISCYVRKKLTQLFPRASRHIEN